MTCTPVHIHRCGADLLSLGRRHEHAIELTLKWLIRLAARYLVSGGYTKENLSPEKLDRKLDTHNVK